MMAQPLNHVQRNAHVGGDGDVVEHQGHLERIGQRQVVVLHLGRRQRVVRGQGSGNHVGTGLDETLSGSQLLAHAVASQSGIDGDAPLSGFLGGCNHLHSALSAHGIAFAGGSHNEGSHAATGHIVNNTFYGKGVDTSILTYRSHHGHNHAMVFLHFLHSVFLIC